MLCAINLRSPDQRVLAAIQQLGVQARKAGEMRTAMSSEGSREQRQGSNLLERLQCSIALLQRVKQAILPLRCLNVGEHLHIKHQAFKPMLLSRHAQCCFGSPAYRLCATDRLIRMLQTCLILEPSTHCLCAKGEMTGLYGGKH